MSSEKEIPAEAYSGLSGEQREKCKSQAKTYFQAADRLKAALEWRAAQGDKYVQDAQAAGQWCFPDHAFFGLNLPPVPRQAVSQYDAQPQRASSAEEYEDKKKKEGEDVYSDSNVGTYHDGAGSFSGSAKSSRCPSKSPRSRPARPASSSDTSQEDMRRLKTLQARASEVNHELRDLQSRLQREAQGEPPALIVEYAKKHEMQIHGVDHADLEILMVALVDSTDGTKVPPNQQDAHRELIHALVEWLPVERFYKKTIGGRVSGEAPIHMISKGACKNLNRLPSLQRMLERLEDESAETGVDHLKMALDGPDSCGRVPLTHAVSSGNLDGAELLVKYGTNLEKCCVSGKKHIYKLAFDNSPKWAKTKFRAMLLARGISIPELPDRHGPEPDAASSRRIAAGRRICMAVSPLVAAFVWPWYN